MVYATAHAGACWPEGSARRYESFEEAEKAARRAIRTGRGGTLIFASSHPKPSRWNWLAIAQAAIDGLDRVWTDLNPDGARLV